MKLDLRLHDLRLKDPWRIASTEGSSTHQVVICELTDAEGATGIGEAAPSGLYGEYPQEVLEFCRRIDTSILSFGDVAGSMARIEKLPGIPVAARCGLNIALLDGAATLSAKPVSDFLGLRFRDGQYFTSFSIGLDEPEVIRQKVQSAASYPVLKLKLGSTRDLECLEALRSVAQKKPVRVDANGAWKTKEQALKQIEWLAQDTRIEFVEQPMPRGTGVADLEWLKARSPLPLFADESCHSAHDVPTCAQGYHGVNVKLAKTGGISRALETLHAARKAGLKTMIGCMIETSVLISAAAQLAELADYLDLDGNLLITNDPYLGVTAEQGILSFANATSRTGLRVSPR
jgi:L-alanine-DL-glutamate epimerase-like enolase superfamily enzyme